MRFTNTRINSIAILLLFAVAIWARIPQITRGLPFAYDEDELTHFQRVVRILQTGDFNPHFFYKPALHFYLRVPVTAIAFFKAVERGDLRRTKQLKAMNDIGPQGFEPTFRHPLLLKYNRAWSILISLLLVGLTILLAKEFVELPLAIAAGLFLSLSPAHYVLSSFIGVDMLTSVFCILSILCCLRYFRHDSAWSLIAAAASAGCAIATKYNAFPILLVPALSAIRWTSGYHDWERQLLKVAGLILLSITFFLICAPYTVLDFRSFIDGAAYEIWHYKRTGTGEPGWPQLVGALTWIAAGGVGYLPFTLGAFGVLIVLGKRDSLAQSLALLLFPTVFLAYMSMQRQMIERNFVPVLPIICVLAVIALNDIVTRLSLFLKTRWPKTASISLLSYSLALLISIPTGLPVLAAGVTLRETERSGPFDTRTLLEEWVNHHCSEGERIAIPEELFVSFPLRYNQKVALFRLKSESLANQVKELASSGVNYVVLPSYSDSAGLLDGSALRLELKTEFPGDPLEKRLVSNPYLKLFRIQSR